MPELPEVESIRLGLLKVIMDQKILKINIFNEKIISSNSNIRIANKEKTADFIKNLINKKIINISRRAKNIIIEMEDESIILIHLKMTGQLMYNTSPHKHTHIIWELENGRLYYNDIRKFGYVLYYNNIEEAITNGHFQKMGVEPLDNALSQQYTSDITKSYFTLGYFTKALANKKKSIKAALLAQDIVVGVGNIYADEICFASKILPQRLCPTLTEKEARTLYHNIKNILQKSIDLGGSSVSDYMLADGSKGNYAQEHKVYGRSGKKCLECSGALLKDTIAGRTTVYCQVCQK